VFLAAVQNLKFPVIFLAPKQWNTRHKAEVEIEVEIEVEKKDDMGVVD
jgi:hypothetical protein